MNFATERLARSLLVNSPWKRANQVVRALGAVQAQDYEGAKWAISQRSGLADEAIEAEFSSGALLRTHVLRPTWHFVHPLDIRWMLKLTAPRILTAMSSSGSKLGLDEKTCRRANTVIEKALRDHNYLTRTELKAALEKARFSGLTSERMTRLVMRAELDAVICSGPRRGKQFTYALLDERAPAAPVRDRDEDLRDLTLRYFHGRSPASVHDFAWWSGLAMRDVRRGIAVTGGELESLTLDGTTYWRAGNQPSIPEPSAYLLPNYDEFFIGHRNRSAIGERIGTISAVTGGSTLIAHVLVVDGQLVGGWKRRQVGETIVIEATVWTRLSATERSRLKEAVAAFEKFAGRKVIISWSNKTGRR